ncbi:MAG: hypothetical protein WCT77_06860 [Bacteroidota bacterium]
MEIIKAEVEKENVKIYNTDLKSQCCSEFYIEVRIEDKIITITERDTSQQKCRCMCNYDLDIAITQLRPGTYTTNIYREELKKYHYSYDTSYYIGNVQFEISTGLAMPPNTISFNQSKCHDTTDFSKAEENSNSQNTTFFSPYIDGKNQLHIKNSGKILKINIFDLLGNRLGTYDLQVSDSDIFILNLNSLNPSSYLYKILFYNYHSNEINLLNIK